MIRIHGSLLVLGLALLMALPAKSSAQVCPDEPNKVTVQVSANVGYDTATHLYSYSYTVFSAASSLQEIDRFAIETVEPVSNIESPPGWASQEQFGGQPVISWYAIEVADPNQVDDDASIPPSTVQIMPGDMLAGFSFKSTSPPGQIRYFVTGFVPLAGATTSNDADAELAAEALVESCPHLQQSILDQAVVGSAQGPVNATIDLALSIDGPDTLPSSAFQAHYVLNLVNQGFSVATQPVLTIDGNTLGATATIETPAGWTCTKEPHGGPRSVTLECSSGVDLAAGSNLNFNLTVNARPTPEDGIITLQGVASSPTPDTNPANNSASFSTTIVE